MTNKIEEALLHYWGARCEGEQVDVCPTCAAWVEYDSLKAERDRIVAWLRSLTEVNVGQFVGTLQYLADNIEAGEHLK